MTTKTKFEQVLGELDGEGQHIPVKLDITVKEFYSDESPYPADSTIDRIRLSQSGARIPDGTYTLRYSHNGKLVQQNVRIQYGELMSGS